jgi:hypothetical protein
MFARRSSAATFAWDGINVSICGIMLRTKNIEISRYAGSPLKMSKTNPTAAKQVAMRV